MIAIEYREPNFRCDLELGTDRVWCLAWGEDEAKLRAKLEQRSFTVHAVKPYEFKDGWKKKADEATQDVLLHGKPDKWKSDIWTEIKGFLFLQSHGKCGYCESLVQAASAGEVEHYRPKGQVAGDGVDEKRHPGYYWLAYNLTNYVPTCTNCNTGKGKLSQFPIAGKRALSPTDDLNAELPLLLNPFTHDPKKHLKVVVSDDPTVRDYAFVVAAHGSQEGDNSWRVYNLNRGPLLAERRRAMETAEIVFTMLMQRKGSAQKSYVRICEGKEPYAAAALAKLTELFAEQERFISAQRAALPK